MKLQSIIITLLTGIIFLSCNKKDGFDGTITVFDPPVFSDATPNQAKVKQMFNTYGVIFKPTFDLIEYTYNWETSVPQTEATVVGVRYTPAKENYVIPVIDSVDSWVFKVLGAAFTKKYMPLNILMTDTMENKQLSGTTIVHRLYEGYIATNYILIPYVSARFDAEKTKRLLRDSWLSLFIEKILPKLPSIADFAALSATGYAKASFTNAEDVMTLYALLKKGRTKQTTGTATSAWNKSSVAQDFGDFVAFIVYTPDAEKQLAYNKNAAILSKVNIVKDYFKTNFGITLPYIPTNP
ncbi:MAG: putative zinc-binding metallopeptidase [Chitinophagaceae bacterium]